MKEANVYYIKQETQLPDYIFQQFLNLLPEHFQKDIKAYKYWQGAQASLLGKILLLYAFKNMKLNYSLHDVQVGYKDRPFINDAIDFNISHSGAYVIAGVVQQAKLGIDIEKHRILIEDIAARYFDKNECSEIQQSSNPRQTFFDLWTMKESAIKCDGRGVEVLSKTNKEYNELKNTLTCDGVLFHYFPVAIEENYACCFCSNEKLNYVLTEVSLTDLTQSVLQ